jgi:hypothetical protein
MKTEFSFKLLEKCCDYLRIIANKGKGKNMGLLKIYNA